MTELLALGISHKTTPVALRERLAFTEAQAVEFAGDLARTPEVSEAVVISTCNRTEVYLVVGGVGGRRGPRAGGDRRAGHARPPRGHPPDRARAGDLLAAQLRRGAPALPGDRRAGVDDRRGGRDPGAGQARPRGSHARRRDRPAVQPAVRGRAHHRQARALGDRHRLLPRERALGGGGPRPGRARRACATVTW